MSQLLMRRPHLDGLPPLSPLPPGMTLRLLRPGDEPALAAMLSDAFEEAWAPEHVLERLAEPEDVKATFVIESGDALAATASARLLPQLYPGSGYVHWVGAGARHRGQRLGHAVTLAVLHEFTRLGCRDAVLETDDFRLPAIKTYLNLGFIPEGRDESHPQRWKDVFEKLEIGSSQISP